MPLCVHPDDSTILLGRIPLFDGLRHEEISRVHTLGRREPVAEGQWLFREGERADTLFLLGSGRVRIVQKAPGDRQVVVHLVAPGEVFGCSALTPGCRYAGSAEVVAAGCVERFDAEAVHTMDLEFPEIARNALRVLAARMRALEARYRACVASRVETRLAETLVGLAASCAVPDPQGGLRIAMRLSRQDLAELAGTTMFTVSRTLAAWEQRGLVDVGRHRVRVVDLAGLRAVAAAGTG